MTGHKAATYSLRGAASTARPGTGINRPYPGRRIPLTRNPIPMSQKPANPDHATSYERRQQFNRLVAWLHSFRYKHILRVLEDLSAEIHGRPIRVLEIGCASAKLYGLLHERFAVDYTGIEPQRSFIDLAESRYGTRPNLRLICGSAVDEGLVAAVEAPDIIIALETLEHIPEHDVVRIVENVARRRPRLFVCSVPVEVGPIIWIKNVGSLLMGYMRHREYLWRETFWAGLYQLDRLPPHGTGHKGFDWRWLAQTIRHNLQIVRRRTFPFAFLPAGLSASVFFVARPRPDSGG